MQYQVTGNEYVSLPTIRQTDAAIEGVTFLYMQAKGTLALRGKYGLIKPYVSIDGRRMPISRRLLLYTTTLNDFQNESRGSVAEYVVSDFGQRARQSDLRQRHTVEKRLVLDLCYAVRQHNRSKTHTGMKGPLADGNQSLRKIDIY